MRSRNVVIILVGIVVFWVMIFLFTEAIPSLLGILMQSDLTFNVTRNE